MNEECLFLEEVFQGIVAKSLSDLAIEKARNEDKPEQKPGHDEEHGMNTDGGETSGKFKDKPDPENKDPGAEGRGTDSGVSWEAKTDSPGQYKNREEISMSEITSKEHEEELEEEEEAMPKDHMDHEKYYMDKNYKNYMDKRHMKYVDKDHMDEDEYPPEAEEEVPPVEGEMPPVEEAPVEEMPPVEEEIPPMEEPIAEEIPEDLIVADEEPEAMEEEVPPAEAVPEMGGDMGGPQVSLEDLTAQVQELAAAIAKLMPGTEEAAADAAEGAAEVAEELSPEVAGELEEAPMMAMSDNSDEVVSDETVAKDVGEPPAGGSVDDPPSDQADIKITDAPEMGSDGGGDEPSDQKDPDIDDAGQGTSSLAVEPQEDHENKIKELNQLPRHAAKSDTEVEIPFLWETKQSEPAAEVETEVETKIEAKGTEWTVEKTNTEQPIPERPMRTSRAVPEEQRMGISPTGRTSPAPITTPYKQVHDLIQKFNDGELRTKEDVMKELGLESGHPDEKWTATMRVKHPAPKPAKLIR